MARRSAPFFPTVFAPAPKGSSVRSRSPIEVGRHKKIPIFLAKQPDKSNRRKKHDFDLSRKDRTYNDWDSAPDFERSLVDKYLANDSPEPHMPSPRNNPQAERAGDRLDYGRAQERGGPGRQEPQRSAPRPTTRGDVHEAPEFDVDDLTSGFAAASFGNVPPFPDISIYAHIHLLRQSGATVKYTSRSRTNFSPEANLSRPQLHRRISGSGTDRGIDMLTPSGDDINAIDQALRNVLNTGGEVEFSSLHQGQPSGLLSCSACLGTFSLQQERDEHINGGRIKCSRCAAQFPCQTMIEEHMQRSHGQRNSQGYTAPPPFGSPAHNNEQGQWSR